MKGPRVRWWEDESHKMATEDSRHWRLAGCN